ncbi:MAG TPA: N-acetyl-gamma-glutamyl-phosphate reductase [Fimbriimonas sp.]
MNSIRVAVVGATGYGGAEAVRLLAGHPCARVATVTSSRNPGKPLSEDCPWLDSDLLLEPFDPDALDADVAFLCQEAGFAMEHAPGLSKRMRVIDFSADFRLKDRAVYEAFYQRPMTAPDVDAVYGLPELVDDDFTQARIVANPGCYPTSALLGLVPLMRAGLVAGIPVIDSKSGVSGAGRSRKETEYLFGELSGGFKAYGIHGHRHTPEIEQLAGTKVRFTPHLIPIARGILTTIHVPIKEAADLDALFRDAYQGRPFVKIRNQLPSTKQVMGSNRCDLHASYDESTGYAVVVSVLDNLGKGAAGQAIQSMNLMFGLPEETGLPTNGVWP